MDGQWIHQESLRSICQGLRLHNRFELKVVASTGPKAPRAILIVTLPELISQSPRQETVSS